MSKAFASLLARRFAPLDFSSIPGFPHAVPDISEWGDFLPIFKEKEDDNPAEHLLKFHECMDLLDLQHEDVRMKMFMYSLYGDARVWYSSLPPSCISSLKDFHKAFNERCKKFFPDELLFDNCCQEFNLHNKAEDVKKERSLHHLSNDLHDTVPSHQDKPQMDDKGAEDSPINSISVFHQSEELVSLDIHHKDHLSSEVYEGLVTSEISTVHKRDDHKCMHPVVDDLLEEYVVEENVLHHDQEINDSHYDNYSDAFDIISNASTVVTCHEDQIFISENFEDVERTNKTTSDSFRFAEDEEDSLPFSYLQALFNSQLGKQNHDQECVNAAYVMGSSHFPELQKKTNCRHLQEVQQNGLDQKFSSYFPPAEIKRFTYSSEFCGRNEEQLQHNNLEQQLKEVFFHDFEDPIADLLDSMSSINVKKFLSDEDYLYHLFKYLFCIIWSSLLFGSRSITMTVNQFLSWLHWKSSFT